MDPPSSPAPTVIPGLRRARPRQAEPLLGGSPRARRREAGLAAAALLAGLAAAAVVGTVAWFLPARPPPLSAMPAPRKGAAVAVVWESGAAEADPLTPRLLVWSGKGHHRPGPASPVAVFANLDDAWSLGGLEGGGGIGCAWRRLARLEGGGSGGGGGRGGGGGEGADALLAEPAPRWKAVAAAERPPCAGGGPGSLLLFGGDAQVQEGGRARVEDDYLADAWRLSLVGGEGGGGGGCGQRRRHWPWPWRHKRPPAAPTTALWDPLLPSRARAPLPRRAAAGAIVPGAGGDGGGSGPALVITGGRPAKKGEARLGVFGDVWSLTLPSSGGGGRILPGKPSWARLFPPAGCGPAPRPHKDGPACTAAWAAAPPPRKGAAAVSAPAGVVTPGPALVIFGGRNDAPGDCYFADAWAFDVVARAWTRLDGGGGGSGASPSIPPGRDHAGALLDDASSPPRLLVYGGRGGANYTSSAPLPLDEVWELPLTPSTAPAGNTSSWRVRPRSGSGKAPAPRFLFGYDSFRSDAVTGSPDTYGVVMGGEGAGGALYGDAWRYSAAKGEWVRLG